VVVSGVINAYKITDRGLEDLHVVVNGAAAAGIAPPPASPAPS